MFLVTLYRCPRLSAVIAIVCTIIVSVMKFLMIIDDAASPAALTGGLASTAAALGSALLGHLTKPAQTPAITSSTGEILYYLQLISLYQILILNLLVN